MIHFLGDYELYLIGWGGPVISSYVLPQQRIAIFMLSMISHGKSAIGMELTSWMKEGGGPSCCCCELYQASMGQEL